LYNSEKLVHEIAGILDNKKAEDVVVLDISKLTVLADYFVIASGKSEIQVKALYDELEEKMEEKGICARHRDGYDGRWIVLDYGDIIVHLFHHEERAFYSLERLWADADRVSVPAEL
jgi:ribosome-associated protein